MTLLKLNHLYRTLSTFWSKMRWIAFVVQSYTGQWVMHLLMVYLTTIQMVSIRLVIAFSLGLCFLGSDKLIKNSVYRFKIFFHHQYSWHRRGIMVFPICFCCNCCHYCVWCRCRTNPIWILSCLFFFHHWFRLSSCLSLGMVKWMAHFCWRIRPDSFQR